MLIHSASQVCAAIGSAGTAGFALQAMAVGDARIPVRAAQDNKKGGHSTAFAYSGWI